MEQKKDFVLPEDFQYESPALKAFAYNKFATVAGFTNPEGEDSEISGGDNPVGPKS